MRSTRKSFLKQCQRPVPSISRYRQVLAYRIWPSLGSWSTWISSRRNTNRKGIKTALFIKRRTTTKVISTAMRQDGDAYVMFYRQDSINDPEERKHYADKYGKELKVPDESGKNLINSWLFFIARKTDHTGGALFRSQYFIAAGMVGPDSMPRGSFHSPMTSLRKSTMRLGSKHSKNWRLPQNIFTLGRAAMGSSRTSRVTARATATQTGWGGTTKSVNGDKWGVKGELTYGPTPGGIVERGPGSNALFYWGSNCVVSSLSEGPGDRLPVHAIRGEPHLIDNRGRDPGRCSIRSEMNIIKIRTSSSSIQKNFSTSTKRVCAAASLTST